MATDFWGVVFPNYIAATGGLIGAGVAIVSLIVALRARGTAAEAVAADAETREAVAIVAKPVAGTVEATSTVTGSLDAETPGVKVGTPSVEWEGTATPPTRTPEEQKRLEGLVKSWTLSLPFISVSGEMPPKRKRDGSR